MTVLTLPPDHLLSIEEWTALDEIEHGRYELQEGRVLVGPSPGPDHQVVMGEVAAALHRQVPDGPVVLPGVDIDLELAPPGAPGFSRRPDVLVVDRAAMDTEELIRASQVILVVEITTPDTRRTDQVIKRGEYADAGIPHYWIVDIEPPVSLVACNLVEGLGYQDTTVTGELVTTEPFDVRLVLDDLLYWRRQH